MGEVYAKSGSAGVLARSGRASRPIADSVAGRDVRRLRTRRPRSTASPALRDERIDLLLLLRRRAGRDVRVDDDVGRKVLAAQKGVERFGRAAVRLRDFEMSAQRSHDIFETAALLGLDDRVVAQQRRDGA